MVGARAGYTNDWCAFKIPINNPLTPKTTVDSNNMRNNSTVNASWSPVYFGAIRLEISGSANMNESTLALTKRTKIQFITPAIFYYTKISVFL